ncbi:uncharacterized protein LOC100846879 isoform X2 [Brachypodium distachyon]|uniref:Uncharacterized protein n=1 Tax=Brachypodium distachyon TaxID=15368 RepID=I1J2V5_BRADI|nr:uncharacterized protein LOC100846879 isoform X2 [Brachypodium distachyon]KQJ85075.1 hypothetical protein BRADI_5g24730v3 [Brachypodium distachyon]|eukprot:XP_010240549.1 uncharacterized protein LOC100846879 isoform X2 [Brachypodium distachyon]
MASLFRARRRRSPEDDGEEEDRSGAGRAKRRRLSPEEAALTAAEEEGRSPGWLSTIVTGAKRVITSVLFSSQEETASAEEEEEEEEEEEDGEEESGNEDARDSHRAIVPYSESKIAIEEMVMKETFSRDECDKMVKLLQSRVVDSKLPEAYEYGTPKEIPTRDASAGNDFTGAWRTLNRNRNIPESSPFSSIGCGNFSPASPLHASPELCNAAVTEAKKWLEEKRQGLGTKPENGPCTLNTDMLNSDFEFDKGSPVDLAKSYMQSLPPWQSPLLGSRKLKTPPSGGVHFNDEGKSKFFSSTKVTTKDDFISSSNFWENLEELRRSRIGFSETYPDASKLKHNGSTSKLFDIDVSVFSSGTREEVRESMQSSKGSDKAAAVEPANGCSLPIAPTNDGNDGAVDSVDPAKDSGNQVRECHAASEVHPDAVPQGNHMPPTSDTKDAAGLSGDVKSFAAEQEIHEETHINSTSVPESRPKVSTSLRSLKKKVQNSLSGSTNKTSANGLLDRSDGNSGLESSGNDNPSCTNSSGAVPPTSNELIDSTDHAADDNSVDNDTKMVSEKPVNGNSVENGAGMDSEKPVEEAPKPSYVRRGRKRLSKRQ